MECGGTARRQWRHCLAEVAAYAAAPLKRSDGTCGGTRRHRENAVAAPVAAGGGTEMLEKNKWRHVAAPVAACGGTAKTQRRHQWRQAAAPKCTEKPSGGTPPHLAFYNIKYARGWGGRLLGGAAEEGRGSPSALYGGCCPKGEKRLCFGFGNNFFHSTVVF